MGINAITGVIERPVSIADVKTVLQVSENDLGTLCTKNSINSWSRRKPVRYNKITPMTEEEFKSTNYGFLISSATIGDVFKPIDYSSSLSNIFATTPLSQIVSSLKPRGGSYNEPYRLTDFEGYNHTAKAMFEVNKADRWDDPEENLWCYSPAVKANNIKDGTTQNVNTLVDSTNKLMEDGNYIFSYLSGTQTRYLQIGLDNQLEFSLLYAEKSPVYSRVGATQYQDSGIQVYELTGTSTYTAYTRSSGDYVSGGYYKSVNNKDLYYWSSPEKKDELTLSDIGLTNIYSTYNQYTFCLIFEILGNYFLYDTHLKLGDINSASSGNLVKSTINLRYNNQTKEVVLAQVTSNVLTVYIHPVLFNTGGHILYDSTNDYWYFDSTSVINGNVLPGSYYDGTTINTRLCLKLTDSSPNWTSYFIQLRTNSNINLYSCEFKQGLNKQSVLYKVYPKSTLSDIRESYGTFSTGARSLYPRTYTYNSSSKYYDIKNIFVYFNGTQYIRTPFTISYIKTGNHPTSSPYYPISDRYYYYQKVSHTDFINKTGTNQSEFWRLYSNTYSPNKSLAIDIVFKVNIGVTITSDNFYNSSGNVVTVPTYSTGSAENTSYFRLYRTSNDMYGNDGSVFVRIYKTFTPLDNISGYDYSDISTVLDFNGTFASNLNVRIGNSDTVLDSYRVYSNNNVITNASTVDITLYVNGNKLSSYTVAMNTILTSQA